jgi:mevalonate kinase
MFNVTARTPAKLIISGEHAVLFGQPAIAIAVNRYVETVAASREHTDIHFSLLDLDFAKTVTGQSLQLFAQQLHSQYQNFLNGNCSIREVLQRPFELLQYAVAIVLQHIKLQFSKGMEIAVRSNVPVGCGMGSSAAAVISTMTALDSFLKLGWQRSDYLHFGQLVENLQHGKSSGLDLHLVTHGGCVQFLNSTAVQHSVPQMQLYIVNTGTPLSSTGECVAVTSKKLQEDPGLLQEFGAVCKVISQAINANDVTQLQAAIKINHQLLQRINVVPEKVANFISALEQAGMAAKICGAGAISGAAAGIVLIVARQDPTALVAQYGYSVETIRVDQNGTCIV